MYNKWIFFTVYCLARGINEYKYKTKKKKRVNILFYTSRDRMAVRSVKEREVFITFPFCISGVLVFFFFFPDMATGVITLPRRTANNNNNEQLIITKKKKMMMIRWCNVKVNLMSGLFAIRMKNKRITEK